MSESGALLERAYAVLDDGSAHSNRAACWIARAALEGVVDELLAHRGRIAPEASMRSRLSILQVAYEVSPDVAGRAEYAWSRLSQACHHHAYELTPTAAEVRHLLDAVADLDGLASNPAGEPTSTTSQSS